MSLVVATQQTKNKSVGAGFGEWANTRYRGQVFTAPQTRIDALLFYVQFDGGASSIGYKITIANVNQTTNIPTTDIYSFEVPMSQLTQNKFNRVVLPTPVTGLTVGTKYAVYFAPWNTSTHTYSDYYRDLKWSNNDADFSGKAIKNVGGTWSTESNLQLYFQLFYDWTMPTYTPDYTQPALPTPTTGWNFNSVDKQVTTKHWNQDATKTQNETNAIINETGAGMIAIAYPLDNLAPLIVDIQQIHTAGKKVSLRSHYNGWEGDNDYTVHVSGDEYQARFYKDIQTLAPYLQAGDSIAMCCEANRADNAGNLVFRTSGTFDYTKYNNFQKAQVHVANKALADASVTGVHTWAISHSLSNMKLNLGSGVSLDSGETGNASGLQASDITTYFAGRFSFDHYLSDTYRQSNSDYWVKYNSDLNKLAVGFPGIPFSLDEVGYHTTTSVSDDEQFAWYDSMLTMLRMRTDIIKVNCWNHMGQSQSSLWTDSSGSIVTPGRKAVQAIKAAFAGYNAARGW